MNNKEELTRSLKSWRKYGQDYLEAKEIEDARMDAWLLMEYVCNISKSYYYMHMNDSMDRQDALQYQEMIQKRGIHIPVQYLIGEAYFYGQSFKVNEHVLIPRQDTEILIEECEKYLQAGQRVLDLCTGSGCILLTLIRLASVSGVGSDISPEALAVAKSNEKRLHLHGVTWIEGDLFEHVTGTFDLIVSNPPYIATGVIPTLMEEVREHEPMLALDGHEDGLYFYRKIVGESAQYLNPGGRLLLEIGYDQAEALTAMLTEAGFANIEVQKDLADLARVVSGRWLGGIKNV
ncbi:MAG: peptide chain release factor N(5)-glutamine methyltransferase [Lachnospiraceae bacterium]|nr:peptide chain release factor N(5)-glutamine methyltransferase [Lachnospiraceae bacterium]